MQRILGVDFREKSLNASIIDSRFRVAKPVKSDEVVLPADKDERDAFILETFKRWKREFSPDRVVVGLAMNNFSHQIIEMPVMRASDLRKAISFELEKYLPLPVDEYFVDFATLLSRKDKVKVLVLSIKKDIVNNIFKYAKEAGLDIYSVRCSTIGSLCGFLDISGEKNIKGLFVNVTDSLYEIAGLENSMPVFFKGFSKNIDLSHELEKLLPLYPGQVYINGNAEMLRTEKINIRKYQFSIPNILAVSGIKKMCLNLNFLPKEYSMKGRDYYPYMLGSLAGMAVVIFLLTGIIAYYKDLSALRSIEAQISSIKNRASGVLEARKKLDLLKSDRKVLMDFRNRSNIAIKVMSDLTNIFPKEAWLINLSVDEKGKVELEGFTKKTSDLVIAIENSGAFKNVSFTSPIISKDGEERFAIRMEVEGLEKE